MPLAAQTQTTDAGPIRDQARITALDLIRGVAVLGILLMNAVSFAFVEAAYYNVSADGTETWLDWVVGIFGEIFIDQKFMGMFSLLFGAGIILFIDRAARRGARAVLLSLWRNVLLLGIGIAHFTLWYGDVLWIYAVSAFILLPLRRLPNRALLALGAAVFMVSVASDLYGQSLVNAGAPLGGTWSTTEAEDATLGYLSWFSYIARGPGMVLIGAALYRMGFMDGGKPAKTYRVTAVIGWASAWRWPPWVRRLRPRRTTPERSRCWGRYRTAWARSRRRWATRASSCCGTRAPTIGSSGGCAPWAGWR